MSNTPTRLKEIFELDECERFAEETRDMYERHIALMPYKGNSVDFIYQKLKASQLLTGSLHEKNVKLLAAKKALVEALEALERMQRKMLGR